MAHTLNEQARNRVGVIGNESHGTRSLSLFVITGFERQREIVGHFAFSVLFQVDQEEDLVIHIFGHNFKAAFLQISQELFQVFTTTFHFRNFEDSVRFQDTTRLSVWGQRGWIRKS